MEVRMAQITEVKLVDDLDGGEAVETIAFTLDGKSFEIDLNGRNAAGLRDALAPFVGAARRAGGSSPARAKSVARATGRSREEAAAIRDWANANGYPVSARGRIPSSVAEAYENRASASVAVAAEPEPEAKPKRRPRKKVADPFAG